MECGNKRKKFVQNFSKLPRVRTVVSLSHLNIRTFLYTGESNMKYIKLGKILPAKKRIDQDSSLHRKRDKFAIKEKNPRLIYFKSLYLSWQKC